jgi:hypothetical protein
MFESLNSVDWDLLHQQKLILLEMLNRHRGDSPEASALSGIINLLDALQDDAAAAGCCTFPEEASDAATAEPLPAKRYYVEDDEGRHHGPMDDYEEAATVAEAVHGRIIVQEMEETPASPEEENAQGSA